MFCVFYQIKKSTLIHPSLILASHWQGDSELIKSISDQNKKQLKRKTQLTKNAKHNLSLCASKALWEFMPSPSTGIIFLLGWALPSAWKTKGQPLMQGCTEAASWGCQSPISYLIRLADVPTPAQMGTACVLAVQLPLGYLLVSTLQPPGPQRDRSLCGQGSIEKGNTSLAFWKNR